MAKFLHLSMLLKNRSTFLLLLFLMVICCTNAISKEQTSPTDTIVIQNGENSFTPFTFLNKPILQIVNNQLNISVTDRTGDMIQLNGIDTRLLKKGKLKKSAYRVVYISQKRGTLTDDKDIIVNSILEIKCANNNPGTSITIGLIARVGASAKKTTIYATLSGKIPPYTYIKSLSK